MTPVSAGYYNLTHPSQGFAILSPDEAEHDLSLLSRAFRMPEAESHGVAAYLLAVGFHLLCSLNHWKDR